MPTPELSLLLSTLRESSASDFYRTLWGSAEHFDALPVVSREDFLRVPLSRRRYKSEKSLVRVVHEGPRAFLSEWSFSDIARESYGLLSKRPFVFLTNPHDAIEKSIWCYGRNMLPLIGEKDPDIATFAAEKYQVDSLITDAKAISLLVPYLSRRDPLQWISILGDSFNGSELMQYKAFAQSVRLVMTLPETGAFAEAALADTPAFAALSGCTIEQQETLVVTKDTLLVTPIVKYKTTIPSL